MLEIVMVILIVIGAGVVLLKRSGTKGAPRSQAATYVCPHCGEKDCHCERSN